jgi:hypothetical protein
MKRIGELDLEEINFDSLNFKVAYQLLSVLNSNDFATENRLSVTYQNAKNFKQALSNRLHQLSEEDKKNDAIRKD